MHNFSELIRLHGYPFFLYDEQQMHGQLCALREALPDFEVLYSVKTNPHPALLRYMRGSGVGADVASAGEVRKALEAGFSPKMIFYSAPGKAEEETAFSLERSIVAADSLAELERLNALAAAAGRVVNVGLRINPDIAFGPGPYPELLAGVPAKFGVDEESLADHKELFARLTHLRVCGIHVFLRSQILSHEVITAYCRHVFALAHRCAAIFGRDPEWINFGGGFGIACGDWPTPLDLAALRRDIASLVAEERPRLGKGTRLCVESGRFLVAAAGTFVTRVEDVKISRGKTFVIVPGGLNGFFRPAFMNLLNSLPGNVPGPLEPLYSNSNAHSVSLPEAGERPLRQVTVTGNLCTSWDILAKDALLPEPQVGDVLVVDNAGAYAATLSPHTFAGFARPGELYRDMRGDIFV